MDQVIIHGLSEPNFSDDEKEEKELDEEEEGALEEDEEEPHQQVEQETNVSLLQEMLGCDHLISIFASLDGFFSTRLALVCKDWHRVTLDPLCWQAWCAQAWWRGRLQNQLPLYGTWRDMFINRPHVRFDRLYFLEKTWFRAGAGSALAPVGTVVKAGYYRYLRFRPQGRVLYALVAHPIRSLKEHHKGCKVGQYIYSQGMLQMTIDMEYMDGFMQAEFVAPARGGLVHDGLKVCSYNAVYKGDYQKLDPPGVFELQPLASRQDV